MLFLGYVQAGFDASSRIERALIPAVPPVTSLVSDYKVWITPEAYTGIPQINLSTIDNNTKIDVPAGSELFAQFSGARLKPKVQIDGKNQEIQALDAQNYQARHILTKAEDLRVALGWQTLAKWNINLVPDTPPAIDFRNPPQASERGSFRLEYVGRDDYGLKFVKALVTKPNDPEVVTLDLPAARRKAEEVQNVSYHDLAFHSWAGSEVMIQLVATDDARHEVRSKQVSFVLPEREFKNREARLIAETRKGLMQGNISIDDAISTIAAIHQSPQSYKYDLLATLSLRIAGLRLLFSEEEKTPPSLIPLLWDVALRLEDNGLSLAERYMRAIEKALQEALARGAGPEEIENLMNQFERAMSEYLNSMYQQMVEQGLPDLPAIDPNAQSIDISDIDRMLQQIRQLTRSGNHEEAQKLLSKLQEIMANIKSNPSTANSEQQKKLMALIREAQELIRQQQQVLDQTYQIQEKAVAFSSSQLSTIGLAQKNVQQKYRQWLSKMQQMQAPEIPQLQQARQDLESAMKTIGTLQESKVKTAQPKTELQKTLVNQQTTGLQNMREGLQELLKKMNEGGGRGMAGRSGRTDPFGRTRPGQGLLDDETVKVPAVQELQRAQEILDELQRRSGDYSRPSIERDYINRLLRRFD